MKDSSQSDFKSFVFHSFENSIGKTTLSLNFAKRLSLIGPTIFISSENQLSHPELSPHTTHLAQLERWLFGQIEFEEYVLIQGQLALLFAPHPSYSMMNKGVNYLAWIQDVIQTHGHNFKFIVIDNYVKDLSLADMPARHIVVSGTSKNSIIQSYRGIKNLCFDHDHFELSIILNRSNSQERLHLVTQNLQDVCAKYLGLKTNIHQGMEELSNQALSSDTFFLSKTNFEWEEKILKEAGLESEVIEESRRVSKSQTTTGKFKTINA